MKSESEILTGICTKVPLLSVGCENNGTTGTDPFLMNMGPCIGVTAESFWSAQKKEKKNSQIIIVKQKPQNEKKRGNEQSTR